MPQKLRCKIFVNLILLILVIQLRHLVGIYEMARINFDVPMIEHLQKTPIEQQIKVIYSQTPQARENDKNEHRFPMCAVTAMMCSGVFYY